MDDITKEMKKERDKYIKQYQRAYKELQNECNNLKELIDNTDPLNIDFNSKVREINNLKDICNQIHYNIVKYEYKY